MEKPAIINFTIACVTISQIKPIPLAINTNKKKVVFKVLI